jgi:type VI secretion system protein ImpH
MAPRDRTGADRLTHLERLAEAPEKHHLFHAFRVLEAAYPDQPRVGEARRPREDSVRFGQEAEMSFPPSTISDFQLPKNDKPGRLTNRFFGLFGPQGPLPLHLTEYARGRVRHHRDPTLVEFANMLTHRMMSLFYRAWRSGQPAPSFDRGDNDGIERKIAAIAGYHGAHLRNRDAAADLAKRHFSGLLSQGPRNAEGLKAILQEYLGTPIQIEEFVGEWLDLEPDDRWELGAMAQLGETTSIGERVWTRHAKFRIRVGPLALDEYKRLLPGGPSLARLCAIVRNYVGDALDYEVNLVLRREDVPEAMLGQTVQLGQTSWVGQNKSTEDAGDLYLEPVLQSQPAAHDVREKELA